VRPAMNTLLEPAPWDTVLPDHERRVARLRVDRAFVAAALLLVASVPIENAVSIGPASLARVAALAALLLLVARVLVGLRLTIDRPSLAAMLVLASWALLSYFWSAVPVPTLVYASTILQLIVLVIIVGQLCTTPQRLRLAMWALTLGGLVGAVLAIRTDVAAHGGVPRYSVGDPNDFGLFLTISVVSGVHLALTTRRPWARVRLVVSTALQLVAITRTASRTALIALVVALLIIALTSVARRPKPLLATVGVAVVVGYLAFRMTNLVALNRLEGVVGAIRSGDFNNRTAIWSTALRFWDGSPLTGIAGGAFHVLSAEAGRGTAAHSVLFGVLAELGVVGIALFAAVLLTAAARAVRAADPAVRRFLLAAAAAWACGALTLTLEDRKITWLLLAFATCEGLQRPRRGELHDV
jgi:O-antigen ligase